jgi:hypothetical protein
LQNTTGSFDLRNYAPTEVGDISPPAYQPPPPLLGGTLIAQS